MKKPEFFKNLKNERLTSATGASMGLTVILLGGLKLFKVDLGNVLGIDSEYIFLGVSGLISNVLLLFAKDPKKNDGIQK
jgi:hypothetical protein